MKIRSVTHRFSWVAAGSAALVLIACGGESIPGPGYEPPPAATLVHHDPIVFVHGFQSSGAIWTTMIDRLIRDGWTDSLLVTWSYDANKSNVTTAELLRTKVDSLLAATGANKVDIIAHSIGGLSSRYYSRSLGGSEKIDALIVLGTPNHGTTWGTLCPFQSCSEMRSGSGFLTALNSGDETHGSARYATWWTSCDQVTRPAVSVVLDGASNTQTACMQHGDLYMNLTVYEQVRDWVR